MRVGQDHASPLRQQRIQIVIDCRADTGLVSAISLSGRHPCLVTRPMQQLGPAQNRCTIHTSTAYRRYLQGQSWSAVWEGLCP